VAPLLFWAALAEPEEVTLLLPLERDISTAQKVACGELNRLPSIQYRRYDVRCQPRYPGEPMKVTFVVIRDRRDLCLVQQMLSCRKALNHQPYQSGVGIVAICGFAIWREGDPNGVPRLSAGTCRYCSGRKPSQGRGLSAVAIVDSYWITISLTTWLLIAVGTAAAAAFVLRPWSPPRWVGWLAGAIGGSLAARPAIYQIAAWFAPLLDRPALREMPSAALTFEFLSYYVTNWSVIIAMWMASCTAEAWWRAQSGKVVSDDISLPARGIPANGGGIAWTIGIFSKLPANLGHDVLALHSEDHYVRIDTRSGDALVLGTISDAIKTLELSRYSGQRVHRYWWVA
jgi:hypothetical protein